MWDAAGIYLIAYPAGSRFGRLSGGEFNIYLSGEDLPNRLSGGESLLLLA